MDVLKDILYFYSFKDHNINMVLLGTLLLGFSCGLVGVIVSLNKKALIVDSISHSILPGICIGFLISGTKNPLFIIPGGIFSGAISVFLVNFIRKYSKIKNDAAIAIVLSTMFSLGVITLNIVQNTGNPNQSGLNDYLFGKAATIVESDVYLFTALCLVIISSIPVFYRHFKIYLFDNEFGTSIGLNKNLMQIIISSLIIICTAIGIQTVGIVLMAALIVAPASTALFWSRKFHSTLLISAITGMIASLIGVTLSYLIPKAPTGPWIVVSLATIAITSAFISPRGIVNKNHTRRRNNMKMLTDNILKAFFKLGESKNQFQAQRTIDELISVRQTKRSLLVSGLKKLKSKGWVINAGNSWFLTDNGVNEAKRIVKVHRLWELYLQKNMQIASDHVHDSAETIEHIITPELEKALEKEMGKPEMDPHNKQIPYTD